MAHNQGWQADTDKDRSIHHSLIHSMSNAVREYIKAKQALEAEALSERVANARLIQVSKDAIMPIVARWSEINNNCNISIIKAVSKAEADANALASAQYLQLRNETTSDVQSGRAYVDSLGEAIHRDENTYLRVIYGIAYNDRLYKIYNPSSEE